MRIMCILSTGSVRALLLRAAQAASFPKIVHAVYIALIRQIAAQGEQSRFTKTGRGLFTLRKQKD